jgi:cobalt-zinc-cadmium efflux system outer membrane protein
MEEAVDRALASNPSLGAGQAAVAAVEQQAQLDALGPPLTVGAEVENFAGSGDLSGFDEAEVTLTVGKVFERGGKRDARQALGATRVAVLGNEMERRRLDLIRQVKHRFIDVAAQQALLQLAEQESALARETREAVAYRVKRGASPEADLSLADLAVARAELDAEDLEHELESARVALSVLWRERLPDYAEVAESLVNIPGLPAFDELARSLGEGPDQNQFAVEAARLEAERRLAEAARTPDLQGTLGVRRLEAFDDQALVLSFALPVGLGQRSDLAIARGRAESTELAARREATELERYRTLFATYQELRHARHELDVLRDKMIPSGERALALSRRGYDEARYSFLQVSAARSVLQSLYKDRVAAAARYHRLLADLERATGVSGVSIP